jgi:hypothetical protein
VLKQMQGNINTFCIKCRQRINYSQFDDDGSYTKKCNCGCEINRFHVADKYHDEPYFLQSFISKKQYNPNYKKMNDLEKSGFKKIETSKGVKYVK